MTLNQEWRKLAEDDPEELSILSAVMGVTREVGVIVSCGFLVSVLILVRPHVIDKNWPNYTTRDAFSAYCISRSRTTLPTTSPKLRACETRLLLLAKSVQRRRRTGMRKMTRPNELEGEAR